jgi:hypothetical protein
LMMMSKPKPKRLLENFDRRIRYFVKLAELKSLSKAADHLDLT